MNGRGQKRLRHAVKGPLTVDYGVTAPIQAPGRRLVIYRAADAGSQRVLDAIARECA
ncbi:hypothetical protein [Nonomuraea sp. NPDC003201]